MWIYVVSLLFLTPKTPQFYLLVCLHHWAEYWVGLLFEKEYREHITYFSKIKYFKTVLIYININSQKKTSKSVLTLLGGILYFFTSFKWCNVDALNLKAWLSPIFIFWFLVWILKVKEILLYQWKRTYWIVSYVRWKLVKYKKKRNR